MTTPEEQFKFIAETFLGIDLDEIEKERQEARQWQADRLAEFKAAPAKEILRLGSNKAKTF